MDKAEGVDTSGVGYCEEDTAAGTSLGRRCKGYNRGMDYPRTINVCTTHVPRLSSGKANPSVNTIDNLKDGLAEVGCDKVRGYGEA